MFGKAKPNYERPATVIAKDTIIESKNLKSKSSVQINGEFIGEVQVDNSLVIGQTGKITGNIKANFILIAGEVNGDLDVKHQVQITKTARVKGNVTCQSIVMDEGAHLEGYCKMNESGQSEETNTTNKKSQTKAVTQN